eukprot:XP_014790796.1 PREDICTED: probable serine/threonine-protein kinase DDB_G0267686 [Octopus bimaculoides]
MKQFTKALQHSKPCFQYLRVMFPKISDSNIKEGIFVGPYIRQLIADESFEATLNESELGTWYEFKDVCKRLLGKHEVTQPEIIVGGLIKCYQNLGSNMSLKIQFFSFSSNFFLQNIGGRSCNEGEDDDNDDDEEEEQEKENDGNYTDKNIQDEEEEKAEGNENDYESNNNEDADHDDHDDHDDKDDDDDNNKIGGNCLVMEPLSAENNE